jgi:UDP-N-acetylglucosamine 4-epimerase
MSHYQKLRSELATTRRRWLVTGAAGFIGSHLVETLLGLGQIVVGFDNFSTGSRRNLESVRGIVGQAAWERFRFVEGDISDPVACRQACEGMDYVLHQAALGSVPRSIVEPVASFESNVMGFLQILLAARDSGVKRVVYASSSAVYGSSPELPKRESVIGDPLSPYAATKLIDEIIADVFGRCYGCASIGLRYFNVFGPRQDPNGPYAAVIPKWVDAFLGREPVYINGDGETSRDFCYVGNVVQANLLAATTQNEAALNQSYNVAVNSQTTLNQLFEMIRARLSERHPDLKGFKPVYREFRAGDVRHSMADLEKVRTLIGYQPMHTIEEGMGITLDWYLSRDVVG